MMEITVDKVQDSIGQMCPMPIVNMAKNMRQMQIGQILEVRADDEGAQADIPTWCKQTGNEYLGSEDDKGFVRYFVKKVV
ncbi:MAG: sulfurtransferase TusA family protein [Anaerolineae bacterium]